VTYLEFLAWFVVPLLAAVALVRRSLAVPLTLGAYVVLAVVWTTPWDGYLIANGVWAHGDVAARFLRVPAEEYAFMVGQALATGWWTLFLLDRRPPPGPATDRYNRRFGAALLWAGASIASWILHPQWTNGFYLTAIVGWFGPLFALQSAVGADRLAAPGRRLRLLAVGAPTAYLWIADRIAIGAGTWTLSPDLTLPVRPLGLPVEEALFFLLTNLVLVNGLILATDPPMWARLHDRLLPLFRGNRAVPAPTPPCFPETGRGVDQDAPGRGER
jgi:lycopene cyclase domain-containing protein